MVARGFWSIVLALFAWLPLGREQVAYHAQRSERSVFAASALDVAAESAVRGRMSTAALLPFQAGPRPSRGVVPPLLAIRASRPRVDAVLGAQKRAAAARPWSARAKRLTIPHDATAPPLSVS
ncbi:MAG: hypothetical protein ACJ796_23810 [Gemmatimonadaceae bacterium]